MPAANRSPEIVAVTGFFFAISSITVFLRVYVRGILLKSFGIDDYFIILAWICFAAASGIIIAGHYFGVGQHRDVTPVEKYEVGIALWYFCEMVYGATILFTKISIALYLKRIAARPVHLRIINAAVLLSSLFSAFFLFYLMFQCKPIDYYWTRYGDGVGTCRSAEKTGAAIYAFSAVNAVIDFTVALVPWLIVRELQMNARMKISVVAVLMIGSMTSIATVIRIPYLYTLENIDDFAWATGDVTIWSSVEMGLGITAACMATLKPIFKKLLSWTSTHTNSSKAFTDIEAQDGKSKSASKHLSKFNLSKRSRAEVELDNFQHGTTTFTKVTGGRTEQWRGASSDGSGEWIGGTEIRIGTGLSGTNTMDVDEFSSNSEGIMKSTRVEINIKAQSIHEGI